MAAAITPEEIISQLALAHKTTMLDSPLFDTQQTVANGVTVRFYQHALNKAMKQLATFAGSPLTRSELSYKYDDGDASYLGCNFHWELGLRHGNFTAVLTEPNSVFLFDLQSGNKIGSAFSIDFVGSVEPYALGSACGWNTSGGPTFSASDVHGSIVVTFALVDHQIAVSNVSFSARVDTFHVDLGPISDLLNFLGLQTALDNWLRAKAEEIASNMISEKLPAAMTALLRDKLNFNDTIAGVAFAMRPNELSTTTTNLTLRMDTTMGPELPTGCPGSNCTEPVWPSPTALPAETDTIADGAASVGVGTMQQGLWALWRSGKISVVKTMDAQEVMGALVPGLPVSGEAELKVWTDVAPTLALNATADADLTVTSVKASIKIAQGPGSLPLNVTLNTTLSARAVLEITPPFIGNTPNPEGNRIQFRMTDFVLGPSTAQYGPGSATLTTAEKQRVLDELILPLYREKIGTIVLSSAIVDFKLSDGRRAALNILRKERIDDSLAVYFKLDISPVGDTTAPVAHIDDVAGLIPSGGEVIIGSNDAIVTYSASDDLPQFLDYVKFETQLAGDAWVSRDYLPAVKLVDLSEGANWFNVRARDFAGNTSSAESVKIIVDTQPPTTLVTQGPAAFINTPNTTVSFSAVDVGAGVADYAIGIDGGAMGAFAATTTRQVSGLSEGAHTITIYSRDKVGHVDTIGAKAAFTVDMTPPSSIIAGARTGYVRPTSARFALSGADNFSQPEALKFAASLSGPACASSSQTFDTVAMVDLTGCLMSDGEYTLQVRAQDQAGNVEANGSQRQFKVDGTAPSVALMEKPATKSNDAAPRFVVAGVDNMTPPDSLVYSFRVRGMMTEFSPPVADPVISLDTLPSGDYVFEVSALDFAENTSSVAVYAFALDNVPPTTSLLDVMPEWVTSFEVNVPVTGDDDRSKPAALRYEVSLDGDTPRAMALPLQLVDIAEGRHNLTVRAIDEFGNGDPVGVQTHFTVDRTPPQTVLESKPSFIRAGAFRPQVSGNDNLTPAEEMRYSYRVSKGGKSSDWSPPVLKEELVIPLAETGSVKIELAAMDNAGLVDADPVTLEGNVRPATGCACSSSSSPSEVTWLLLASLLVWVIRQGSCVRRRSGEVRAK